MDFDSSCDCNCTEITPQIPITITEGDPFREPSTTFRIILLVVVVPLIFETIFGNFLILLAWLTDARVRTPSNAYLASLALVDFLMGLFNMTLGSKYIFDGRWRLGVVACRFWLTSSCSLSFISAAHLALVALDRHRIVYHAASYVQNRPYTGVLSCVLAAWASGLWIVSPLLLDWEHMTLDPQVRGACLVKFNIQAVLHWATISVILPGVVMVWLYARIYVEL